MTIKETKKTYLAITIFLVFWLVALLYIVAGNKLNKKFSSISWGYNQVFHQSWQFFMQPAIYNDKLVVILKKNNQSNVDSIDVLNELWKQKRTPFNNATPTVWDEIMFRQIRFLRLALQDKKLISYNNNDSIYNLLSSTKNNKMLLNNITIFSKQMLQNIGYTTTANTQLKIVLYTNYTPPFNKLNTTNTGCVVVFTSNWKPL
jgi:hypothetical protein